MSALADLSLGTLLLIGGTTKAAFSPFRHWPVKKTLHLLLYLPLLFLVTRVPDRRQHLHHVTHNTAQLEPLLSTAFHTAMLCQSSKPT